MEEDEFLKRDVALESTGSAQRRLIQKDDTQKIWPHPMGAANN
jgi:hypothetical protein